MILIIMTGFFLACLSYLAINEGVRPALVFLTLWIAGFFASSLFGVSSGAVFIAWEAILCVLIQFFIKFRRAGF